MKKLNKKYSLLWWYECGKLWKLQDRIENVVGRGLYKRNPSGYLVGKIAFKLGYMVA